MLWALTTYFNHTGNPLVRQHYDTFRNRLGCPLLTVELARDDGELVLEEGRDADKLVTRRGNQYLFYKENMMNIGMEYLPDDCDKVVWIDADVVFDKPNWHETTSRMLDKYKIGQPFGIGVRLEYNQMPEDVVVDQLPWDWEEKELANRNFSFVRRYKDITDKTKCFTKQFPRTGLAFAARRHELQECSIYDKLILGSGDNFFCRALVGQEKYLLDESGWSNEPEPKEWCEKLRKNFDGEMAFLPSVKCFHLWHGTIAAKKYVTRHKLMKIGMIKPHHFSYDEEGVLYLHNIDAAKIAKEYFIGRDEAVNKGDMTIASSRHAT